MWFQEIFSCAQQQPTIRLMREHGEELDHALRAITATSIHYLSQLVEGGVDGIFFATQYARDLITDEEFNRFCRPYELEILDYLQGKTWFNMLHVHGDANLNFNRILDYPVQALNWETSTANVPKEQLTSFRELRQLTDKVFIGGIDQTTDFYVEDYDRTKLKANLERRLEQAIAENGSNRFVFAPGCTLPMDVNHYAFTLIQEVAEESGRHV
ncbi:methylcobalamin:coenzyme M methyltransferase [compost metagenome]